MKKVFAKKMALAAFAALAAALFSACQEVVYDNIRKEVELEDGNIAGDVRSIIRFKDSYYISNGSICTKSKDEDYYGAWKELPTPAGHVIKIAADGDYLYALVGTSVEDTKEGINVGADRILYYTEDGTVWDRVSSAGNDDGRFPYTTSNTIYTYLFCTNTIDPANRSAYFVLNDAKVGKTNKAYRLKGAAVEELELGTANASTKPMSNAATVSRACVYYKGDVYFFNSIGVATNETTLSPATIYYYSVGSQLFWDGEKSGPEGISCKATIQSLGVTDDYILVGTTSGIAHHVLSDGVPGASAEFKNNAAAVFSNAYIVLTLLVAYPEWRESETAIYASQVYTGTGSSNSAQFDHIGLWAYYPARGNWNRE